jgi:hypothetical protein
MAIDECASLEALLTASGYVYDIDAAPATRYGEVDHYNFDNTKTTLQLLQTFKNVVFLVQWRTSAMKI